MEKSRQEYRVNARKLVAENEALQNAVNQVGNMERERERERGEGDREREKGNNE